MAWNMEDYPNAFKNFDRVLQKKMIDIANALVDSGYEEGEAIPIAIEQGKEWYENASEAEQREVLYGPNPQKSDDHDTGSTDPSLLDEDVMVYYEDDQWKVKTVNADQASNVYTTKNEAVKRAREIAENKDTHVQIYKQNGDRQN